MAFEWPTATIGEVATIKHGFAFKGEFFTHEVTPNVLVTPGNFATGGGFQIGKQKYYAGPLPDNYVLSEGDIVVTMTDLSKESDTLGYAAKIPTTRGVTYWHNQRIGLLQVKDEQRVCKNWLHYLMRTHEYRAWVVGSASGTTVKHTSPSRIESFSFKLPPLEEQRSIADTLGALDDRIDNLRQTNATLQAIAAALFKSWFVDFEGVPPEDMQESALGLIPTGWRVGSLADLAELNASKWTDKKHPQTVRYIDLSGVSSNRIEAANEFAFDEAPSRARLHLREGDTIVGTVRPGNRAFAYIHEPEENLTGSTGFAVLSPKEPHFSSFVYLAATRDEAIERLTNLADGAAYPAVRPNVVADTPSVIASNDILAEFSAITKPMLERIVQNRQQAATLAALRDTLLPRLISGRLRISETNRQIVEVTA